MGCPGATGTQAPSHWPCLPQGKERKASKTLKWLPTPELSWGEIYPLYPQCGTAKDLWELLKENRAFTEIEGVLHWGWFPEGSPDTRIRTTTFTLPDTGVPKHNTDFLASDCLGKLEGTLADF